MAGALVVPLPRLIHIVSGVFWVGSILFLARFLFPASAALGPAADPVMGHSRLALYWRDSMGSEAGWMGSPTELVLGAGGALAILAFLIGLTINLPTAKHSGKGPWYRRDGARPLRLLALSGRSVVE